MAIKDKTILIRVTTEEFDRISAIASAIHMKRSEFIRKSVLENANNIELLNNWGDEYGKKEAKQITD